MVVVCFLLVKMFVLYVFCSRIPTGQWRSMILRIAFSDPKMLWSILQGLVPCHHPPWCLYDLISLVCKPVSVEPGPIPLI